MIIGRVLIWSLKAYVRANPMEWRVTSVCVMKDLVSVYDHGLSACLLSGGIFTLAEGKFCWSQLHFNQL